MTKEEVRKALAAQQQELFERIRAEYIASTSGVRDRELVAKVNLEKSIASILRRDCLKVAGKARSS